MNRGQFKKGRVPWNKGLKFGHSHNYVHIEKELLESLYWGNQYTMKHIAKLFNMSVSPVCTKFKEYNIPTRTTSESLEISKEERSGMNSPNWKGGRTSASKSERNSPKFKKWRFGVFDRDRHTCQVCHQVGKYLEGHHIKSFAEYPEFRYDMDNGITLCSSCHKWVHRLNPRYQQ